MKMVMMMTDKASPPSEIRNMKSREEKGRECYDTDKFNSPRFPAEVSEGVPPQVAEAMLMQSPLATSLLQSFLATSLWFGSPDNNTQKRKQSTNTKQKQQHQVSCGVDKVVLECSVGIVVLEGVMLCCDEGCGVAAFTV